MANIPTWAIGKHAGTLTLTGQTVSTTDGTLSDATGTGTQTLLTIWDEIDLNDDPVTEEISAGDAVKTHTVFLQENWTLRCTQIMQAKKQAAGVQSGVNVRANPLAFLFGAYDYFKANIAFSGSGGADAWTTYLARGSFSSQWRKGKSVIVATFNPCDPTSGATTLPTTYTTA